MPDSILVGDIGGTNARFALGRRGFAGHPLISEVDVMKGDDFDTFEAALNAYCRRLGNRKPERALFALAGPVHEGRVELTNRDWTVDAAEIEQACGFSQVRLVNDYAAMARSIPELPDEAFRVLHQGSDEEHREPILVAGPGTGLGMATLIPMGSSGWRVLTGEGGHAAYTPRDEREWSLFRALEAEHGYVSHELVLSGSGLNAVHKALCEIDGVDWQETAPEEIMKRAEAGTDPIARDICEIRARGTLGALGDGALTNGTLGGVVVTGGVAERLADWLAAPDALQRFFERGPRSRYMEPITIRLLMSGEAALVGAAALHFDEGVPV